MVFLKGKPCQSGKSDSVIKHESSEFHSLAEKRQTKPGESEASNAWKSVIHAAFEKMRELFNIVHALAKKYRPLSDYVFQTFIKSSPKAT